MNFPSLPTDNLYKFCAIAGLAVTLLGLTYLTQKTFGLQMEAAAAQTEINVMVQRVQYLQQDAEFLKSRENATVEDSVALRNKVREAALETIRMAGNNDRIKLVIFQMWIMLVITGVAVLVGVNLAWFGFSKWYNLVQKPADRALAAPAPTEGI